MGLNSRRKGVRAQNEVAKIIQEWWSALEPGCEFVSTPQSGGWSTVTTRAHFQMGGDLMTTAMKWPFVVEVKRREGWSFENFANGRKSPVWGWWRQAVKQAAESGGQPMLWARKGQEKPGESAMDWVVLVRRHLGVETEDLCNIRPDFMWVYLKRWHPMIDSDIVGFWSKNLVRIHPRRFLL